MEFQNLTASDNAAIRELYTNPFSVVRCPRCGNQLKYVVKGRLKSLGILYDIECSNSPRCFFYPIPPTVTPECIRWQEPDHVKPRDISYDQYCSSCRILKYCAVHVGRENASL